MAKKNAPAPKAAHPKMPMPLHGQLSGAPAHRPMPQGKTIPSISPQPFHGQLPQSGIG